MNNTESRTTFIFNLTWAEQLAELDDATRLRFMDAIIAYAKDGTMPKMSALEKALFIGIQADIDLNNEKFEAIRQKRSEAGKKGGLKSGTERSKTKQNEANEANEANASFVKQNEAKPSKTKQSQANEAEYENEYENEYEYVCDEFTPHTYTHDTSIRIDNEISSLKQQTGWLDEEQTLHHVPKDNLIRWLDQFAVQLKADGHPGHANQRDLKSHFNRWLAPKLKEQQQKTSSQHDRRSRTNITAGEVKDYNTSF